MYAPVNTSSTSVFHFQERFVFSCQIVDFMWWHCCWHQKGSLILVKFRILWKLWFHENRHHFFFGFFLSWEQHTASFPPLFAFKLKNIVTSLDLYAISCSSSNIVGGPFFFKVVLPDPMTSIIEPCLKFKEFPCCSVFLVDSFDKTATHNSSVKSPSIAS